MEDQAPKPSLKNYIDQVISDDGLRTEVIITLTDDTRNKIIITGLIVAFGASVIVHTVGSIARSLRQQ